MACEHAMDELIEKRHGRRDTARPDTMRAIFPYLSSLSALTSFLFALFAGITKVGQVRWLVGFWVIS